MNKETGGPAFPQCGEEWSSDRQEFVTASFGGMTLRDYFAAKALQGIMACPDVTGDNEKVARWAYGAADAMLEARK